MLKKTWREHVLKIPKTGWDGCICIETCQKHVERNVILKDNTNFETCSKGLT
jgi:hypothetical protein